LLHWRKVSPIATAEDYQIDWDTTTEPYLAALINFFQRDDLAIISKTSHWEILEPGEHKLNSIFRFLGKKHIFPFNYWGPHFTLVVQKRQDSPGKYSNLLRTLANWLKLSIVVIIIILPFTPILLAGFIATTNFLSKKVKLR
jgi:hypothetical protein